MAKRYELSDASRELIKDLVFPSRKWVAHVVMIVWYSTESFGFCAQVLPGVICRNALGLGRRCISIFVNGAMTVRSTGYWSACTFDSIRKD